MLAIKLARIGKRKRPFYRIVVSPKHRDTFGDHVEIIGTYDPISNPANIVIDKDRALHWLRVGAQPTNTVANILIGQKVLDLPKKRTLPAKKVSTTEEPAEAVAKLDKSPQES